MNRIVFKCWRILLMLEFGPSHIVSSYLQFFETFSFLPALSADEISKQVSILVQFSVYYISAMQCSTKAWESHFALFNPLNLS